MSPQSKPSAHSELLQGQADGSEIVDALTALTQNAIVGARNGAATEAFRLWRAPDDVAFATADDFAIFASEASFAAAARIALDLKAPTAREGMHHLFPHLYSSPLFGWFEPGLGVRRPVEEALRAHGTDNSSELLGWLYQFSIPAEVRKRFGQFYTSPAIAESMLDNLGFAGPRILETRLIDPAVGAGAFVIAATRRVIAAAEESGLRGADICRAVQRVIHGLDMNPLGILLTEAAISLMLVSHLDGEDATGLEPLHLYVTDSLRMGELAGEKHSDVAEEIKSRSGAYTSGFEFVVANPPYAKLPSRLLDEQQKARFASSIYGHPNLYGLFLQVGVELLADGGRLAFINPKSFVSGLYFRNLRRFLTQHLDLERFDTFDRRTGLFDGVLQDVVILTGEKRVERSELIELREFSGPPTEVPTRSVSVAREFVLLGKEFDYSFFISADELAHQLLARLATGTKSLRQLGFKTATGTIVWNRLKSAMRDEDADDALPLVWGNGIRPFRFLRLGNRAKKATHVELNDKTRGITVKGPAILVKRMTAKEEKRRLVACTVLAKLSKSKRGWFAENHVNVIRPIEPSIDLEAVLGLLNSRLYDYVFRSLNGNTQVSATELDLLPIKEGAQLAEIAEHARALIKADGDDQAIVRRLDELVAELYELNGQEIADLNHFYDGAAASTAAA